MSHARNPAVERPDFADEDIAIADRLWDAIGDGKPAPPPAGKIAMSAGRPSADPPASDPPLPPPPKPGDPAAVTGKDVERAVAWWKRMAPPGARGLVDAKAEGDGD